MVVSIKDSAKLIGISIVCFCAVFVCTFFLNFYIDALAIADTVTSAQRVLYDAQLATARFTCAITGGFLGVIAAVMLVFYLKLYVDGHSKQLGILKAIGYSNGKIASKFWIFGLSVFIGVALGFAAGFIAMPSIYKNLTIEGLKIDIHFHAWLPFALVVAPTVIFSALSCGYAYFILRRPVSDMMKGIVKVKQKKRSKRKVKEVKERPFLIEMCRKTLSGKKSLAFFVAFACFCFSAMVQMGASMECLPSATMGMMILAIGVVLAVTTMFMAVTSLVKGNVKNISIMKAFGYSMKECALSILGGYTPFAAIGFGVGTVYQFGLLSLMINVIFKNVEEVPEYFFNVPVFFITLAVFIVLYTAVMAVYSLKLSKISVKEVMAET